MNVWELSEWLAMAEIPRFVEVMLAAVALILVKGFFKS
jgi:hypothetical protein